MKRHGRRWRGWSSVFHRSYKFRTIIMGFDKTNKGFSVRNDRGMRFYIVLIEHNVCQYHIG